MDKYNEAKIFYNYIKENQKQDCYTMLWIISCVEDAIEAYKTEADENLKEKLCYIVYNVWIDLNIDTGISKITDIIISNLDILDLNSDMIEDDIEELIYDNETL